MAHKRRALGGALTVFVSTVLLAVAPVFANEKYLDITLIGDSYTAGNGAGAYYGPADSYRSIRNWGHTYANWLNDQDVHATIHNYAYSGAVSQDVLDSQITKINPSTDLVMMTVGGNDINFASIVLNCFTQFVRSESRCKSLLSRADDQLEQVKNSTEQILGQLQQRVGEKSEVVLVGYPLLSTDVRYTIPGWFSAGTYDVGAAVRAIGEKASNLQQDMVRNWNENNNLKVSYIPLVEIFSGHEPDPETSSRNPKRWVNEFLETEGIAQEDGNITSKSTLSVASTYHPNITGHQQIGEYLSRIYGIPKVAKDSERLTGSVDVAFVVGPGARDAEVNKQIAKFVKQKLDKFGNNEDVRVTVLGSQGGTYTSLVDFTSPTDIQKFANQVADIESSAQANADNAPYEGIRAGLDLNWRTGARKSLYYIGDASADYVGFNRSTTSEEEILRKVYETDTVELHVLNVNREAEVDGELARISRHTAGIQDTIEQEPPVEAEIGMPVVPELNPTPRAIPTWEIEWNLRLSLSNDVNVNLPTGPVVPEILEVPSNYYEVVTTRVGDSHVDEIEDIDPGLETMSTPVIPEVIPVGHTNIDLTSGVSSTENSPTGSLTDSMDSGSSTNSVVVPEIIPVS